ncbi:hypothetical protein COLU111180_18615 [Cohnella lubricantis]|uniref:Uncharacterized protein n=1 Tax=Cohnella lubricantis TaxID=2163172 RepID=A0A841T383_9BACL|nr:hypothetical protein [Cohnella lubricantis]MBB6675794.1 hypothetical protein [Cohnella lubricantis]MBP2119869.1 ABC-type microcin C transport system permease subunit YejB [Cohnella lubricantis]
MPGADNVRAEGKKFFIGDMNQELAGLKERFGLDERQLMQIETMLHWSYNTGFNTGANYGRQLNVHELLTPDVPTWG